MRKIIQLLFVSLAFYTTGQNSTEEYTQLVPCRKETPNYPKVGDTLRFSEVQVPSKLVERINKLNDSINRIALLVEKWEDTVNTTNLYHQNTIRKVRIYIDDRLIQTIDCKDDKFLIRYKINYTIVTDAFELTCFI